MKILIIDSHKGSDKTIPQNMHWLNAKILSDYLGADLIWSYPSVNNEIKTGYDVIIFVHASHYSYVDYKWLEFNPDASLFYITNEYNLGEPRILWSAAKLGRKYKVIANHEHSASKVVMKYVTDWQNININSLVYNPVINNSSNIFTDKYGCIYYGSFRSDRVKYFKKYLDRNVILSTHPKNLSKFINSGVTSITAGRVDWSGNGLFEFNQSLYLEDESTHKNYNHLSNRFYEALNYDCTPIFIQECLNTISLSGYDIPEEYIIKDSSELKDREYLKPLKSWHEQAKHEKENTLNEIKNIIK